MRWKLPVVCAVVWTISALVGAGGVYLIMRPTGATAAGSTNAAAPASDAMVNPTSVPDAASTPVAASMATVTSGLAEAAASTVAVAAFPASVATGASSSTVVAKNSTTGTVVAGKTDVPFMAHDLGPFSSRLRSIACEPRHGVEPAKNTPVWICEVTLDDQMLPYSVRTEGPHDSLAIYTAPLFASGYAFVYVSAHDDKRAHFSATIDPKAAPYPATVTWTSRVIVDAVAQAIQLQASAHTASGASDVTVDPVSARNAQSWAKAGFLTDH